MAQLTKHFLQGNFFQTDGQMSLASWFDQGGTTCRAVGWGPQSEDPPPSLTYNIYFYQKNFYLCFMKKIDMGKYVLLAGNNATTIFDYYKVDEMHGLNRKDAQAEEVDKTKGNGVYIYGWTNYDPADKKLTAKDPYKPFLFLNLGTFKKYGLTEKATAVMHVTMHMSILLNNWKIVDKEEEVITFAEEEANKIIEKLEFNKKETPKKGFFKK
jgi:hypothetical protein